MTAVANVVTVSIFVYAVSFCQFFNKNRGLRSVLIFMVPDVNHTHSKLSITEIISLLYKKSSHHMLSWTI